MSELNTPNVPCLQQWVEDLWCHCQPVGTSGKECLWKEAQNTWEPLAPIPRPREERQTSGAMLWPQGLQKLFIQFMEREPFYLIFCESGSSRTVSIPDHLHRQFPTTCLDYIKQMNPCRALVIHVRMATMIMRQRECNF